MTSPGSKVDRNSNVGGGAPIANRSWDEDFAALQKLPKKVRHFIVYDAAGKWSSEDILNAYNEYLGRGMSEDQATDYLIAVIKKNDALSLKALLAEQGEGKDDQA